jgi:hypothetical protein
MTKDGQIAAFDLGSKGGTFVDGIAVEPQEAGVLAAAGELGLGLSIAVPYTIVEGATLLRVYPIPVLFAPLGCHPRLETHGPLPFELGFSSEFALVRADPQVSLSLNGVALGRGARVEAVIGDRFQFEHTDDRLLQVTLEP